MGLVFALAWSRVPPATSGARDSGIEGQAVVGPTRPAVSVAGQENDTAPYQTTLLVLAAADGHEVARVETGADGRFRVSLTPGEYIVRPMSLGEKRRPRAEDQHVRVRRRRYAQVTVRFDSGLR